MTPGAAPAAPSADPGLFEQIRADRALRDLRRARRRPVFAVVGVVVGLYLLTALLSSEARDLMAVRLAGPLNVGLGLSLLQCGTTVWAARWYARYARTVLDPAGRRLRVHFEDVGRGGQDEEEDR